MTTVGHSLIGVALGLYCLPRQTTPAKRIFGIAGFIALANIPDLPLPCWGHVHLQVSHSLFVNIGLCGAAAAVAAWILPGTGPTRGRLLVCGSLAWLSHFILDAMYGDLPGMAVFWPFSEALLSLPVPWLRTMPYVPPPFRFEIVRIFLLEAITFGPAVVAANLLRRRRLPDQRAEG